MGFIKVDVFHLMLIRVGDFPTEDWSVIFQQRIDLFEPPDYWFVSTPQLKEGRQLRERADQMTKIVSIIISAGDAKFVLQNKLLIHMWIWHEVGHIICEDVWKRLRKCCNFCFECWLFAAFQMSNSMRSSALTNSIMAQRWMLDQLHPLLLLAYVEFASHATSAFAAFETAVSSPSFPLDLVGPSRFAVLCTHRQSFWNLTPLS